ncbi:MAG: sigma-70 family RNA polymerase sigma factor [Solirubrobacteraceae bacterium]
MKLDIAGGLSPHCGRMEMTGAWLRQILLNRVRDLARRDALIAFEPDDDLADLLSFAVDDPQAVIARAEQEHELRAALARLSVGDRAAVALHDGEGWSAAEVSRILGCSTEAAHKRIQRARLALAQALAQADRDPRKIDPPLSCMTARRAASAYLDGLLSSGAAAQVEEHLRSCRACPPLVQALTGIRAALAKGQVAELSPDLRDRLHTLMKLELPDQL